MNDPLPKTDQTTTPMPAVMPRRRVVLEITIGADSWKDAANALYDLSMRCHEGPIESLCSGSPSCGYTATGTEDLNQTHDKYFMQLNKYLTDKSKPNPEPTRPASDVAPATGGDGLGSGGVVGRISESGEKP